MIKFQKVTGKDFANYKNIISKHRIDEFSKFPYNYAPSSLYEDEYLNMYQIYDSSFSILAMDGDITIGILTGIPMEKTIDGEFLCLPELFSKESKNIKDYYYIEML
jgi:hypothetical protein